MSINNHTETIMFIRIVKAHEWIYHPHKKIIHDIEKVKNWSELVTTLAKYRLNIKDPKSKWQLLRDNFVRKHKQNKIQWPFFKEMEFLIPFISHKDDPKKSKKVNRYVHSSTSLYQSHDNNFSVNNFMEDDNANMIIDKEVHSQVNNFPINNFMQDDHAVMLVDNEIDVVQEIEGGIIIDENCPPSIIQQPFNSYQDRNEFQTSQSVLETISDSTKNILPTFSSLTSTSSFAKLELNELSSSSSSPFGLSSNSESASSFSKKTPKPVSVSILEEKTEKRGGNCEKSSKQSKVKTKVVPPWDDFALKKKMKQDDQTERVVNALENTSTDIKKAYSTIENYIGLKSQLIQFKMRNHESNQSSDGFFNIIKREFISLSLEDQKNVFVEILKELELFLN